jgi:hypothetical protein
MAACRPQRRDERFVLGVGRFVNNAAPDLLGLGENLHAKRRSPER